MSGAAPTQAERIALLNDLARRAMGIASVVVATEGIRALSETTQRFQVPQRLKSEL